MRGSLQRTRSSIPRIEIHIIEPVLSRLKNSETVVAAMPIQKNTPRQHAEDKLYHVVSLLQPVRASQMQHYLCIPRYSRIDLVPNRESEALNEHYGAQAQENKKQNICIFFFITRRTLGPEGWIGWKSVNTRLKVMERMEKHRLATGSTVRAPQE